MNELIKHATELIRVVDPTRDQPIYIVPSDEVTDLVDLDGATAASSGLLALTLEPSLRHGGQWSGFGFASVFDSTVGYERIEFEALALHEYIHFTERQASIASRFHDVNAFIRDVRNVEIGDPPLKPLPLLRPWSGHGPAFVRLCCHAVWRARQADWWGTVGEVFDGPNYQLSDAGLYEDALDDEPARLAELPLVDVASIEPPKTFQHFAQREMDSAEWRFEVFRNLEAEKMSVAQILDKIQSRFRQREETRLERYRRFVAAIASGEDPGEEQIEAALSDSGRSIDQLRADVQLYGRRIALRAQLETVPELQDRLDKTNSQIKTAAAELDAARQKFATVVTPLEFQKKSLEQGITTAKTAERELAKPLNQPEPLYADLTERKDELRDRGRELQQIPVVQEWLHAAKHRGRTSEIEGLESRLDELRKQKVEIDAENELLHADALLA